MEGKKWFHIDNAEELISPSLLIYPDRIRHNIELMIEIAGGVNKLRPHIKTHKMAEVVKMQQEYGIQKFKCATIAEAELLGMCDVEDVLLAMQPVGINTKRFFELKEKYPNSKFSTIVDTSTILEKIALVSKEKGIKVSLWMDINNGMNRTGIEPNNEAKELFLSMHKNPNITCEGFHVYDGHIKNKDLSTRKEVCEKDFQSVLELKINIEKLGAKVNTIVAGGSPTFPIHKERNNVDVSPGTTVLWDAGYQEKYKDLKFLPAAVLLTRVVSRPTSKMACLDIGHKAIASEMAFPRLSFLEFESVKQLSQSEEHMVIEDNGALEAGTVLYAIPIHICPTVSKYKKVYVVTDNCVNESWEVSARDYQIKI